jgi:hydrogenase expression/formation protein HypC
MCFNIPSKIISIKNNKAKVLCLDHKDEVNLDLVNDIKIGDYVVVQNGYVTNKLDKKEAKEILVLLENFKEVN